MTNRKVVFFFLLPVLLSFVLHFRVLKLDLIGYHVWRQTQTQTVIYNFTHSDNSIFNPQKFDLSNGTTTLLYEFPLYQWLIAQFNNAAGYSVVHTRVITFIIFILFLAGFYKLLRRFFTTEVSLITNALVCFSPLLYYYCVNPLPDIFALCLSSWSLYFFFLFISEGKTVQFIGFGFFLMLASLVKLPYVLFGGVAIHNFILKTRSKQFSEIGIKLAILISFLIPAVIWYCLAIPTWRNNPITLGMTDNQKSIIQLLDYLQFNIISSVPELLTNYASCLFLVTGIILFFKRKHYNNDNVKFILWF